MAIERSLNWEPEPKNINDEKEENHMLNSVAPALFVMLSLGLIICAKYFQ